jgi:hypothetical protein
MSSSPAKYHSRGCDGSFFLNKSSLLKRRMKGMSGPNLLMIVLKRKRDSSNLKGKEKSWEAEEEGEVRLDQASMSEVREKTPPGLESAPEL